MDNAKDATPRNLNYICGNLSLELIKLSFKK
jgi:hypothetical protein